MNKLFNIALVLGVGFSIYMMHSRYKANLRQECYNMTTDELHWRWRLSTEEVQSRPGIKAITERMLQKSVEKRIEACVKMYEENADK